VAKYVEQYGFEVEDWRIPDVNSHTAHNLEILRFLNSSETKHPKTVYYAGRGRLSNHRQAMRTRLALVNISV
jgi:hypothetical protein